MIVLNNMDVLVGPACIDHAYPELGWASVLWPIIEATEAEVILVHKYLA